MNSLVNVCNTKLQSVLAVFIGLSAAWYVLSWYEGLAHRSDYLYWDLSSHAYYGVMISSDILHWDLLAFLRDINGQVLWPPLHSLLQVPFMLYFGRDFYASSMCSFFFLIMFFPAISFVYSTISKSWFGWLLLMSLVATSPYLLGYGSMPMPEVFGAVLTMVSIGLYLRNSKYFPLSLTALFFLKYNYCFYVLMPVVFLEVWRAWKDGALRLRLLQINKFQIFVLIYLGCLMIVLITGGFKIGNLSVKGIGNPLYILLVLVTIRFIHKKRYVGLWERIRGTGWEYFLISVYVWLLIPIPNRVKTLVSFSINFPLSGHNPLQINYYTFYFNALKEYFSNPFVLLVCIAAASVAIIFFRKDSRITFLALSFGLPFLLMTANQNKQERYLFTFVPVLWLLFAFSVGQIKQWTIKAPLSLLLSFYIVFTFNPDAVQTVVRWPFVPANVDAPVQYISELVRNAKQIRVIGVRNDINPALIMHHIMKRREWKNRPVFKWKLEPNLPSGTNVILINTSGPGETKVRHFPGNISIGHYLVR